MDLKSLSIKSPLKKLDELTGGFVPAELFVVAAKHSVGKTSFILSAVKELCESQAAKPLLFSLEMAEKAVRQRLVSWLAGISLRDVQAGNSVDMAMILHAERLISNNSLVIDDNPVMTIKDLCGRAASCVRNNGCNIIFVDRLELIRTADGNIPLREQSYAITKELKALARKLDVPVVCTYALRKNKCGQYLFGNFPSVEEDADAIVVVSRKNKNVERVNYASSEFHVIKNRNGDLGSINVHYCLSNSTFVENQSTLWDLLWQAM